MAEYTQSWKWLISLHDKEWSQACGFYWLEFPLFWSYFSIAILLILIHQSRTSEALTTKWKTCDSNMILTPIKKLSKHKYYIYACTFCCDLFWLILWLIKPINLVKNRSREIRCYDNHIALKFATVEVPANFQSIEKVLIRISRLRDLKRSCGKTSVCLANRNLELYGWIHIIGIHVNSL